MTNLFEKINKTRRPYKIGDIADIKYGFGLPAQNRISGPVPVYASSGLVGFHNTARVDKPSIIIGRKGNVGSVYYSQLPSYPIDTAFFVDETKKGFDLKYLYFLFKRINLPNYGGDSAVPGLSRDTIYGLDVKVPDFPTQQKIAEILGGYDAKIENNNKIIKNLEATAQTIFTEWFVKFRFPGLKKAKFVESEMGKIPEGWEMKSLDQIADFLNGIALQKFPVENNVDVLPVIKIREMNSGIDDSTEKANSKIDEKYIVKNGDILFSWSGSLELMMWVGGNGALNQHIFKVTSETYPKWFFYQWTRRHLQNFRVIASGKATTMGHIQRHHLTGSLVVVPSKDILKKADLLLSKLFDEELGISLENVSLMRSRNLVLLKLI